LPRKWREQLAFDLNAKSYRSGSLTKQYAESLEKGILVNEIGLAVYNQWSRGYVLIDNLRFE